MKKYYYKKVALSLIICLTLIFSATSPTFATENSNNKEVYLGGQAFGIKMFTDGCIITRTESFLCDGVAICPAKESGIQPNDIIKAVNGKQVESNNELEEIIEESNGNTLNIMLLREDKLIEKNVTPEKNQDDDLRIGVWVRDSCAGIGTITYYDEENKTFGALGHGIYDSDTKQLMPVKSGNIVSVNVNSVTKATEGSPGTLNGFLDLTEIGKISLNSTLGVFGTYDNCCNIGKKVETLNFKDVTCGKAQICSTVDGNAPEMIDIVIEKVCNNNPDDNKNFVIEITDQDFLEKSKGIVQGMSGSPILQNDKLVGAVTHVFVNEPSKGYGVFIENMMSHSVN